MAATASRRPKIQPLRLLTVTSNSSTARICVLAAALISDLIRFADSRLPIIDSSESHRVMEQVSVASFSVQVIDSPEPGSFEHPLDDVLGGAVRDGVGSRSVSADSCEHFYSLQWRIFRFPPGDPSLGPSCQPA